MSKLKYQLTKYMEYFCMQAVQKIQRFFFFIINTRHTLLGVFALYEYNIRLMKRRNKCDIQTHIGNTLTIRPYTKTSQQFFFRICSQHRRHRRPPERKILLWPIT